MLQKTDENFKLLWLKTLSLYPEMEGIYSSFFALCKNGSNAESHPFFKSFLNQNPYCNYHD